MDGILSIANGSSSSLYGCIGYAVQDLIMSKFPVDYFKYTSISSELATRNIRRTFGGNNSKNEIAKRKKPYLIIQPTYSVMDLDGPLQGIPLTKNFDDLQYRVDKRYLFEIIKDQKYGYNLKFKLNRDRIEFDVTVTTSTLHQQLDIYRTILNQIIWDRSYAYRMALESVIPKKLIAIISKYCNMDLETHKEYIPILLKRLNSCSGYPITYKMRNASASDEWFMYYTHNVIITFSDLNIESGNKKNMSDESYNITFRVVAEFNMPGVFMIDGDVKRLSEVDVTLKTKEYSEENDSYFPLYAVKNLYSRFPAEMNGMQLYGTTMFQTTAKPQQLEDRIDIKSVLDAQHMRVIRAHRAWNMNPDTLMTFFVLKNGELLKMNLDYNIDWNTLELVVKNIDNSATYRLIMYFNYATVNEILNNTAYENNFDIDKLKENKFPDKGIDDNVSIHDDITDDNIEASIYEEGKVPEDKKDDPNIIIIAPDPTYHTNEDPHEEIDVENLLFDNTFMINLDGGRYTVPSPDTFSAEKVDPDVTAPFIAEDDPTYCADEDHGKVDAEEVIYGHTVMVNSGGFRSPLKDTYLKGYVPLSKIGDPNIMVIEESERYYTHESESRNINPEEIIYDNTLVLNNEQDRYSAKMENMYMADKIPAGKENEQDIFIVNKDTDYMSEHGVSVEEFGIAGISEPVSTADIHNSSVSKKRFSSSI